jgi:hypothetical protein
MLAMIPPASAFGFRSQERPDAFDKELVCVHVFQPGFQIPDPLGKRHDSIPVRGKARELFHLNIPELLVCSTDTDFLTIFEYFWPIERTAFNDTLGNVTLTYAKAKMTAKSDVSELAGFLENMPAASKQQGKKSAVIFTLNDFTRYLVADILNLWQVFGINEFVLFKDPSKPPYLCSYPALQKGFKRPPPI